MPEMQISFRSIDSPMSRCSASLAATGQPFDEVAAQRLPTEALA